MIKKKNISGISGVITVVIMVALVMTAAVIVWTIVSGILEDRLDEAQSCFGIIEKVNLDNRYTCYNSTSGELKFLINMGDIKVESLLISVSGNSWGKQSFELTSEGATAGISIRNYTGSTDYSDPVSLPIKNSGLVYFLALSGTPNSIEIAPKIGENQCEVTDSISSIDNCLALA